MKAIRLPAVLATFFLPALLFSQKPTASIKGKIVSSDGEPATGVTIELKQLKRMAVSDSKGYFSLQYLSIGENYPTLRFSTRVNTIGFWLGVKF